MRDGLMAEFDSPDALIAALTRLRELGYTRLDAYTPYPVRAIEPLVLTRRSKIPLFMLVAALTGAGLAYLVQWWTQAVDFPWNVGGRPLNSAPAFIPIAFETAVLFAGVTGMLMFFVFARLPRLYDPVFEVDGFDRTTIDRFWIAIDQTDPSFDLAVRRELEAKGAIRIETMGRVT